MMGTEIFKIDASWAEKLTKTRVQFLLTPTVDIPLLIIYYLYIYFRILTFEIHNITTKYFSFSHRLRQEVLDALDIAKLVQQLQVQVLVSCDLRSI